MRRDRSAPGMDISTVRGATGDARPMDERPDAAEPPPATLAHDHDGAQTGPTRPPRRPRRSTRPSPAQAQRPQEADPAGPPRPAPHRSGAEQGPAVSPPPSPMPTLDGRLRTQPPPGLLPPRPSATVGRPALVRQLVLALVCAAYAVGSALGWGSDHVAKIMGDFGLSAASASGPRGCCSPSPRRWRPWAIWCGGGTRSSCVSPCPAPATPTCSSCASRRPPSWGCWCWPSGRSRRPAGSAWAWTPG
ncbi:hypothetical protein SAM23877_5260 [Streptomyces ambofaciens ATCC 23877]|uniref:Uncharacterized protein n=1 Tax=Streptomyces ambofaciens (strain ATCC 23877 / 3486 / DSM 40053 / JCM 4204 / NBRC 12836 / NRRL B-2516) TaxID=278992 RepID=A0A0K2AYU1_STRA7|nr:hypothetical protein SAM23877_5260 [Streptomyces ambofaciens ATCC 23877]